MQMGSRLSSYLNQKLFRYLVIELEVAIVFSILKLKVGLGMVKLQP